MSPLTTLVMQVGIASILVIGGKRVGRGLYAARQMTAFITLSNFGTVYQKRVNFKTPFYPPVFPGGGGKNF